MNKENIKIRLVILKKIKFKENSLIFYGLDESGILQSLYIHSVKSTKPYLIQSGYILDIIGSKGKNFLYPKELKLAKSIDFINTTADSMNLFFDVLLITYYLAIRYHSQELYELYIAVLETLERILINKEGKLPSKINVEEKSQNKHFVDKKNTKTILNKTYSNYIDEIIDLFGDIFHKQLSIKKTIPEKQRMVLDIIQKQINFMYK